MTGNAEMRKIKELLVYYNRKGASKTFQRIKSRYFSVKKFVTIQRDLNEEFLGIEFEDDFVCFEDDIEKLKIEREKRHDLPREFYVDKTHGGKHFYLVYCKGELAYIHWYFTKGSYSRFFKLKDRTVELNYNTTLPKFRGKKIPSKAMNYISRELKKKGFERVVGAIAEENILMRKVLPRCNFKETKVVNSYFSFLKKIEI